jgi:hypothetical protein
MSHTLVPSAKFLRWRMDFTKVILKTNLGHFCLDLKWYLCQTFLSPTTLFKQVFQVMINDWF